MNICTDDFINGMTKTILAPHSEMNPIPYPLQRETSTRLDLEFAINTWLRFRILRKSKEI